MKLLIVLVLVACASAKPQFWNSAFGYPLTYSVASPHVQTVQTVQHVQAPIQTVAPVTYTVAQPVVTHVAPAFTKTQYHAQDELGQASYGYSHPGQAHAALRDAFGNVRGSYAYIDPTGKEVRTNYVADAGGFRVESNALPVGPAVPAAPELIAPVQVVDTPEVAAARAEHFRAIDEARARNAAAEKEDAVAEAEAKADEPQSRKKRGLAYTYPVAHSLGYSTVAYAPSYYHASPLAYSTLTHPLAYTAAVPVATHALREATLTKVINTPGHAVSYRVD